MFRYAEQVQVITLLVITNLERKEGEISLWAETASPLLPSVNYQAHNDQDHLISPLCNITHIKRCSRSNLTEPKFEQSRLKRRLSCCAIQRGAEITS